MAATQARFSDQEYINWVKGTLSLLYLKEGVENVVDTEADSFHKVLQKALGILGAVPQTCSTCTPEDMKKDFKLKTWKMKSQCPLCNAWLQQIAQNHANYANQPVPTLHPENTDPRLWPTNPYEVFKCYMSHGCQGNQSAKDGDAQSILSLLKNCNHFAKCVKIGRCDLIAELLRIRNLLFHSGSFHVTMADLQACMGTMLDFLAGMSSLSPAENLAVQGAIHKIGELKTNRLDVSFRELELIALKQKQIALENELQSLKVEVNDTKTTDELAAELSSLQLEVQSGAAKATATETDLREKIHQVEGLQDQFRRFLQANGLEQDLARLSTAMDKQGQTLEEHSKHLSGLENARGNQENQLQSQQATLAVHDTKLQSHDTSLADHDTQLQSHDTSLADHDTQLQSHDTSLADHDTKLQSHDASLADHDTQLQSHDTSLADHDTQLQSHDTSLADHDTQLQSHDASLADHDAQLQSTQEKIATIEEAMGNQKTSSDTGQMTEADFADLQAALIKHYRDYHLMVPNPVVPVELGLDEIYVPPDIKVLGETKNPRTGLANVQDRATPANTSVCKQLFCTEDYRSKSVYVTSDAGMGKTMFSKHLVNLWCRAQSDKRAGTSADGDSAASGQHTEPSDCPVIEFEESDSDDSQSDYDYSDSDDSQSDSDASQSGFDDRTVDLTEDDISTMSNFQLLFYITLRNSSNKYDIVDMIDAQILRNIKFKKTLKAFDLLQNEGCLVIIDGLDEWVCPEGVDVPHFVNPGIPGRMSLNSNTVYLTTTRPWKFDVLKLKGFDVDKHVELKGLNKKSSKQLCSKVISLLSGCEIVTKARNVWDELKKKGLSRLHNVPVILTQLICLFFDKQELSNSQVQLYCSMIDMLLKRPDKGLPKPTLTVAQNTDRSEKLLPECFSKYRSCQVHQHLLVTLAKIAFEALLNEERENSLVFESSQMTIFGVDQKDIDLCLKAGILSQNKVLGKWSVCEKRMSFLHKKLQEFLAAIFITKSEGGENVLSRVKSYCSTVEKVLEMSQTCMFVSGLNTEVACRLLTCLMDHVVCNDTAVQQYRQNTDNPYSTCIHSIQTCIVDCSVEALNIQHTDSLPLHDFIIHKQTISECLKRLLTSNIPAVKSVFINTRNMTSDNVEFVDHTLRQLQGSRCLQKLYLNDPINVISDDKTLSKTITNNSNLSSLVLRHISLGTETRAAVCGALKHLTALELYKVKLSHKETQLLLSSVSQAGSLRQLTLQWLDCTDHGDDCSPDIDISQLNTSCLQDITLDWVTIQESHLREFIRQLSSVSHKVTVDLVGVIVTADSENPVDLSFLTHDRCLVVTRLWYDDKDITWYIEFHTQQQTTT